MKGSLPNGALRWLVRDVGEQDVYGATQKVQAVVAFASYSAPTVRVPP